MKEIKAKIMKVFGKFKVREYDKFIKNRNNEMYDYCFVKIEELEKEVLNCFDEENK
jgi:hypothetical protein